MGIQQKIIIPFALLIIAAVAISGGLVMHLNTAQVLRRAKEEENRSRMRDEMKRVKEILGMDVAISEQFLLDRITPLFEGKIVLTDSSNRPTIRTIADRQLERIRPILRPPDGNPPSITRAAAGEDDFFVVADNLPKKTGHVYLVFEAEKIGSPPEEPATAVMVVAALSLLIVLGVGIIIARTITQPIKELVARTGEIARGELDKPINLKGGGETSALAEAFNKMLSGLKSYQERLITSEKLAALGQISAGIAHEIRNPLNSISMNVQMMEREGAPDRESLRIILNEVKRLKLVIDELLDFARSPASSPTQCDVNGLMEEVLDLMQRQMEHCGVSVTKDFRASATVRVDTNRMKQVIMNLLLNAMQAMPGGGRISLRTENRAADGRPLVRCGVTDTGHGIRDEEREKIFQPFYSTRTNGAGLGLAICKRIIEDAGGTLDFASGATGTTFWFEIPAIENQ